MIRVCSSAADSSCRRHQLWLGEFSAPLPVDLSSAPEIAKAIHQRDKLFRSDEDRDWTSGHVNAARDIMTARRFNPDPLMQWRLSQRWNDRDAAVKAVNQAQQLLPTWLLVLPESVILAEILMDPAWRRRIGLAEQLHEQRPFAHRLGLRGWAAGMHTDNDPLRRWVHQHRIQHPDTASLAGYRSAIDDLTRRIEGLTTRRTTLIAQLDQAAHRTGTAAQVHEKEVTMPEFTSLSAELPAPADDGAAAHLPGTRIPSLTLQATSGDDIRLDDLGSGRTVIYIYPLTGRPGTDLPDGWDSIPGARGCTPEACSFRDHYQELRGAGADNVFGFSSQDTAYQAEVVERLHLPFKMLSDPTRSLGQALTLPTFTASGLTLYKRLTLIVNDGAIENVFYPIHPPNDHASQVLTWLRKNLR
ncbi:peroxiredoxin [Nocardia sp. bgisy134]|uniref:peroxiredoxin n=1 Tax=Nocardia sp. bgisy134 TaxID=3413789 RepID=UPI003D71B1E0